MKLEADIIFEDTQYLFCQELDDGFQLFRSWAEFINIYISHMHHEERPLYVFKADVSKNNVFVDASEFIVIPWDELENYI